MSDFSHGLTSFNGNKVYYIDDVPTVILSIHDNVASGFTINSDLTTTKCMVAAGRGKFAHGGTVREAVEALESKLMEDLNIDEKIEKFKQTFKLGALYPATMFYSWHHTLTGSCKYGRDQFVSNNKVDMNSEMTPEKFFALVKGAYGWENVRKAALAIGWTEEN